MSKTNRPAFAIIATISLCACQSKREETAMKAIANYARDPSSVEIRNVHEVPDLMGTQSICGEYNAKNRFGGYLGFAKFAVMADAPNIAIEANSDAPNAAEWVDGLCNVNSPYHSLEAMKVLGQNL